MIKPAQLWCCYLLYLSVSLQLHFETHKMQLVKSSPGSAGCRDLTSDMQNQHDFNMTFSPSVLSELPVSKAADVCQLHADAACGEVLHSV